MFRKLLGRTRAPPPDPLAEVRTHLERIADTVSRAPEAPIPPPRDAALIADVAALAQRVQHFEAAAHTFHARLLALEGRPPVMDPAVLERLTAAEREADRALRLANSLKGRFYRDEAQKTANIEKQDAAPASYGTGVRAW